MGGAQRVLNGVLDRTRGMVAGVTCGAGMPYKLSEIAASYEVSYLPIISSARAFRALWKRAYRSEEHTSELQSLMRNSYAVFCLKKKKAIEYNTHNILDY